MIGIWCGQKVPLSMRLQVIPIPTDPTDSKTQHTTPEYCRGGSLLLLSKNTEFSSGARTQHPASSGVGHVFVVLPSVSWQDTAKASVAFHGVSFGFVSGVSFMGNTRSILQNAPQILLVFCSQRKGKYR